MSAMSNLATTTREEHCRALRGLWLECRRRMSGGKMLLRTKNRVCVRGAAEQSKAENER